MPYSLPDPSAKVMKRQFLIIFFAFILLFSVSSCKSSESVEPSSIPVESALSDDSEIEVIESVVPKDDFSLSNELSVEGNPLKKATTASDKKITIQNNEELLTFVQTDSGNFSGYNFDHYKDTNGNLYEFYAGTNIFSSFYKKIDKVALGNTEVNSSKALDESKAFLEKLGFDISSFSIEHSNDYSYDFKITYLYEYNEFPTTEQIVVHLMSTERGDVFLTSISSRDYGRFSKDPSFITDSVDISEYKIVLENKLNEMFNENIPTVNSLLWKDEFDRICLKSFYTQNDEIQEIITYI